MTVKISELPAAGAAAGTDQLEANQGGTSRRMTVAQVATYVVGQVTPAGIGAAASGAVGSSGLTMSTDRLLGRTTASSGAVEEISVGSRLALSAGALSFDASGDFQFESGYGSVATAYGCRAWVNFNGTGTVAIRASGNVSSITDNGTGDYTINFTTAMPDANYSYTNAYSPETGGTVHAAGYHQAISSSSFTVQYYNPSNSTQKADKSFALLSVFR
jgi:hypothetical protein